jgi:hypothetical protein
MVGMIHDVVAICVEVFEKDNSTLESNDSISLLLRNINVLS